MDLEWLSQHIKEEDWDFLVMEISLKNRFMNKQKTFVFLVMSLSFRVNGMAMEFAPMPYAEEKQQNIQENEYNKRKRLKYEQRNSLKSFGIVAFINKLIFLVGKGKRFSKILTYCPTVSGFFEPLHWAVENGHKQLVEDLLEAGADPNDGKIKPLELAKHKKIIECLIEHGADPKLCNESVLVKPLLYYLDRSDNDLDVIQYNPNKPTLVFTSRGGYIVNGVDYEAIDAKRDVLTSKVRDIYMLLLEKGASANILDHGAGMYSNKSPLEIIKKLTELGYIRFQNSVARVVERLIWSDASFNFKPIAEDDVVRNINNWRFTSSELERYIKEQQSRFETTEQFCIEAKNKNSFLSFLPQELFERIGNLVKRGFELKVIKKQQSVPVENNQKKPGCSSESTSGSSDQLNPKFSDYKNLIRV